MLVSAIASRTRLPARGPRSALVAALAIAVALGGVVIAARGASADSSSSLVAMANNERAARGLPSLAVSSDLTAAAQAQASRMASSRTLAHTPNLGGAVCCWSALGENVGEGPSASAIEAAFMASTEHRANILSSAYTQVGIGAVVDSSGTLWVSEIFRRPSGAAAAPPAPPKPPAPVPPAQPKPPAPAPPAPKPVVTRAATPQPAPTQHKAATAAQPPPAAPPAAAQTRASRDLARLSLEAQHLARQLDDAPSVRGVDPVARLLDFVAINATLD